jgi:5,10-methylenetetrahydrofolate reductase
MPLPQNSQKLKEIQRAIKSHWDAPIHAGGLPLLKASQYLKIFTSQPTTELREIGESAVESLEPKS